MTGYVWASTTNSAIPVMLVLKNTEQCIRQRKIWSHVLGFLLLRKAGILDNSVALMIDGDTAFDASHVSALMQGLRSRVRSLRIRSVCATHSHSNTQA